LTETFQLSTLQTMKNIKEYFKPTTIEDAVALIREHSGKGKYIAGGTHVAVERDPSLDYLVDITYCGLNSISETNGQLQIGACTTLEELNQSKRIRSFATGILAETACWTGSIQLRNSATVGGSIVSMSDIALPLIALDAQIIAVGEGERTISLGEFYENGNTLRKGELIKACVLPGELRQATGSALRMSRTRQDVSIVGVVAVLIIQAGICKKARLAVEPVVSGITRVPQAETLLEGQRVTDGLINKVAKTVTQAVQPVDDYRASAAYRRKMIGIYTKRALGCCVSTIK
jgi:carbon-monoxide dehydrogenase medium subunit